MNVTDYQETWQVDVGGQIYEAKFAEMTQWIFEGSLLPQDLVRRGNLRWIEARKVPALIQFFNARENGLPPPVVPGIATDAPNQTETPVVQTQNFAAVPEVRSDSGESKLPPSNPVHFEPPQNSFERSEPFANKNETSFDQSQNWQAPPENAQAEQFVPTVPAANVCVMHPDTPGAFICETCANVFCKACPKSFGGSVKICPFCGAMCREAKEVRKKAQEAVHYRQAITEGFGIGDFFEALAYPFKFKTSLFFGSLLFMLFTLGQNASGAGGLFMGAAALICIMLSNMLTFGVLANTVENFAQGKIGLNFMPAFDDFSLWDDVLHPFFLSLGVYIVSFGLLMAIFAGGILWSLNALSSDISDSYKKPQKINVLNDENGPIRNNPALEKQKNLYGEGEMPDEETIAGTQNNPAANEEEEFRKLNEMINEHRKQQLESGIGKMPETKAQEKAQFYQNFMSLAGPFLILCLISLIWGIFYFPAACCVAGYTRSFVATLNPTVGLETIKLLGWDYAKIWLMGLALCIGSFFVGMFLGILFAPFDLPMMGNLPATAIGALFSFYVWIVFSVVLGLALYKNADKMNLFKG